MLVYGQSVISSNSTQNYRIGPGDVIDVTVTQSTALTRTGIRVNNEGLIQLPMLDEDIPAGCRTERELAELIKEKYKKYVVNPYVIVAVQQFNSNPVAVIGAVNAPGRFQLQRPMRIFELLTWVNGTADRAGSTIEIIRNRSLPFCDGPALIPGSGEQDELISINLADTFKGLEQANPYVRAGDIIRVADAEVTRAYVVGNVKNPTTISLKDPVTLTQAIAMAGGLSSGAQAEKITIRRRANGSVNPTDTVVSLKEISLKKKDDVLLQNNDIIDVPGPAKSILRDAFRILIPTITSLPLRVIP